MSDIVERLQAANEWMRAPDWNDDLELVSWLNRRPAGGFQAAIDEITRLTAEIEKLKADLAFADAQCAKVEGLFLGTHKENEKLRAALLVARKYVLVQSCELSLMPEDAARDLDVIDEALEEDDDQG